MILKKCSKCDKELPISNFGKHKNGKDGFDPKCKNCVKKYYEEHKDNYKTKRTENKEELRLKKKKYYEEHKEQIKKYYETNKEKRKKWSRLYRKKPANLTPYIEKSLSGVEDFKVIDNYIYVRCKNCNEWFQPNQNQIRARIASIKGIITAENNFYCNNSCKKSCNIYHQVKHYKNKKPRKNNNNPEWVKLVKEKDNYICQICGCDDGRKLQAHHIIPVAINPLLAEDLDNGITLCKDCHIKVHNGDCNFHNLKRKC